VTVRVPIFEFDNWRCTYTRQGHLFERQGSPSIMVRRGDYDGQLFVQRGWLRRLFRLNPSAYSPPDYFGLPDGGYQGGGEIELYPKWTRQTQAHLDGTIRRHHIGFFNDDGTLWAGDGMRYPLVGRYHGDGWHDIDGPHYIRAYYNAVALYAKTKDPVARMWLILCATHVMRRFPMTPFVNGDGPEYSLTSMWNNVNAAPHLGGLGICRELAWSLRCVVEAQRVSPTDEFKAWIVRMIDTIYMGQASNGACERHAYGQGLGQEEAEARTFGIKDGEDWCVRWQAPFLIVAVREAMAVVPETFVHGRTILERFRPWYFGDVPTAKYLVMAKDGVVLPQITLGVGPGIPTYDEAAKTAIVSVGL